MKAAYIKGLLTAALALSLTGAQDEAGTQCQIDEHGALRCFLSTLQSPITADGSAVNRARHLRLSCSDSFFLESRLKPGHFGQLPQLEELHIEYCKIRHLPRGAFAGLSGLKRLSLQSHNGEWSSVLMDVDREAFKKMDRIQDLQLAHNNLWSLPAGALCHMPQLQKLNASHNHLLDAVDLGLSFEDGCQVPLVEADLSHNHISSLQKGDLKQIEATLERLDLRSNRLSILGDDALGSLRSLRELNLADNQLAALPPTLFSNKSQEKLQKLQLQNNSLTLLTPDLFVGLSSLVMLNLSHNSISSHLLTADTFSGLASLRVLDLSHNRLAQLVPDTFAPLTSLQVLDIQHNLIHSVAGDSFAAQRATLKLLSLSHNAIDRIDEKAFAGLNSMTSLSLDHNKIKFLHKDQLSSCVLLEDLSFNSNLLAEVPQTLRHLGRLRTLDLGENEIESLKDNDFEASANLYGLRLAGNRMVDINRQQLRNLTGIHVLNLAHNKLASVEQGAFDSLTELRALRLDNNQLTDINGLVSSLAKLQWFNVSTNKLQWFDYAFVPMSLEWLDLHGNEVEELGNYYKLKSGFSLKTLDASNNLIRSLTKLSLPTSLEQLSLNKNAIRHIENGVFEDKPSLARVELVDNEINHLKLSALSVGRVSVKGQPEFYLAGNPLVCDCELEWLPEINSMTMQEHHPRVADLDDLMCRLNNQPRNDTVVSVNSVAKDQFLCSYQTHCFSLCLCCEFYACDCRMQCPDGCSCYHDADWNTNIIQCGTRGHTDVPLLIPMDATEIRLDGNNLTRVDSQSFIGRRRVTSLYMNNSQVTSISDETFSGLSNLEVLHLEDNHMKEVQGHEFNMLLSLKELYLNNNDLIRIAQGAFDAMPMLSVLRLDGNLLTSFPVWSLAASNPFLASIYLAENMWSCDCSFAQPLRNYIHTFTDKVADKYNLKCVTDNLVNEPLLDLGLSEACPDNAMLVDGTSVHNVDLAYNDDLITILVSVLVAFSVVVCGFLAICCYRARIKNWLYNKSSEIYESRSGSSIVSDGTQNKLFDVYISYSSRDAEFVDHTLAPTLEHGNTSYRLCLHQRDFPPSASMYDTVSVATESSARVLVVISRAYLAGEWPHVKIPLRNSLVRRDNKLVLLLLDDLSQEEIEEHPELKQYLRTSASVRWGSPGFMNKLRFFLPEPAIQTFQRSVTLRTLQPPVHMSPATSWSCTMHESPVGSVATQSTTVYNPHQLNQVPICSTGSIYSQHTYQSIPEAHIYHTLEPLEVMSTNKPPVNAVYINKNLELILKPSSVIEEQQSTDLPTASPSSATSQATSKSGTSDRAMHSSCRHLHSQSTLSGQQLLPACNSHDSDEYIV